MKKHIAMIAALAACATGFAPQFAEPAQAQRKIDSLGAGNCIFAKQPLAYGKEGTGAYRNLNPVFGAEDDVYGRCYIADTYSAHRKHGRIFSSLRDEGYYYSVVKWIRPANQSAGEGSITLRRLRHKLSESATWNQQAYYFNKANDCDLKVEGAFISKFAALPNGCVHFGNMARKMAAQYDISLPYTAKFCMEQLIVIANKTVTKWDGNRRYTEPDKFYRKLSGGCFNVRVS